jgi:hypothetical protein
MQIVFKCKHSIFLHVPWGASSFHLKHHFAVIIVFDFTWYHFVLNNIEGVMIPCLSVLWIPGYPVPPAPGPRHRPIFRINDPGNGEDPHEEAPREENDDING